MTMASARALRTLVRRQVGGEPSWQEAANQIVFAPACAVSESVRWWTPTSRRYEPMRKLFATIALTFGVVAVMPASAAAATAIEYGLISA
jgi:hypothetical protein